MSPAASNLPLDLSPEVRAALADGQPVLALESSIIAQGMPWPQNLETARSLEAIARARGVAPATTALMDGRLKVGLNEAELERLAHTRRDGTTHLVAKVSRKDLGPVLARGGLGATTVAATMWLAAQAGIRVFATGGIGGVHRGAEASWDVSADLRELATSPVLVISAGAKAILDLPRTLEVLETLGVPVMGYQTDEFPAFYSRSSGLQLDLRCDTPEELAAAFAMHQALGLGGMLVAHPIPREAEIPAAAIATLLEPALAELSARGITGKAVTPYLLGRLGELSGARTLAANIRLVEHNAVLGAHVAHALAQRSAP